MLDLDLKLRDSIIEIKKLMPKKIWEDLNNLEISDE